MPATATLDTYTSSVSQVSVEYVDNKYNVKSAGFPAITGITAAQVGGLVDALDPITSCRICEVMVDNASYIITTSEAAAAAGTEYSEVFDRAIFVFQSATRCRQKLYVSILGPKKEIFTGQQEILINKSNAQVVTFTTYLMTLLKSANYGGLTDWVFLGGRRVKDELPDKVAY